MLAVVLGIFWGAATAQSPTLRAIGFLLAGTLVWSLIFVMLEVQ